MALKYGYELEETKAALPALVTLQLPPHLPPKPEL